MSRVWIYDRTKEKGFGEKVRKAKSTGRKPPGRWQVGYYDKAGKQRLEIHPTKTTAEDRRTELEGKLKSGTHVDPSAGKIRLEDIGEKWIETRNDLKPTRAAPTHWRGLEQRHEAMYNPTRMLDKMLDATQMIITATRPAGSSPAATPRSRSG